MQNTEDNIRCEGEASGFVPKPVDKHGGLRQIHKPSKMYMNIQGDG